MDWELLRFLPRPSQHSRHDIKAGHFNPGLTEWKGDPARTAPQFKYRSADLFSQGKIEWAIRLKIRVFDIVESRVCVIFQVRMVNSQYHTPGSSLISILIIKPSWMR